MTGFLMPDEGEMQVTDRCNAPGWCHARIEAVRTNFKRENSDYMVAVEYRCTVLGHTDKTQVGKQFEISAGFPNQSHRDGGRFASIILAKMARAAMVLPQAQPGQQVLPDWANAQGRQIVVFLHQEDYTDGDGNQKHAIRMEQNKIWHPRDPELPTVATSVFDANAINHCPPFSPYAQAANGQQQGWQQVQQNTQQQQQGGQQQMSYDQNQNAQQGGQQVVQNTQQQQQQSGGNAWAGM